MPITFDPAKNEQNIAERGISFELAADIDWETAQIREDTRKDYGETRLFILGMIRDRLHALVITPRGDDVRVVSLRKANKKEQILYEKQKARPRTH